MRYKHFDGESGESDNGECPFACLERMTALEHSLNALREDIIEKDTQFEGQINDLSDDVEAIDGKLNTALIGIGQNFTALSNAINQVSVETDQKITTLTNYVNSQDANINKSLQAEIAARTSQVNALTVKVAALEKALSNIQKNQCRKVPVYLYINRRNGNRIYTTTKLKSCRIYKYVRIAFYACKK